MSLHPILSHLRRDARYSTEDLSTLANLSKEEVVAAVAAWEADGTILGYQAVINPDLADNKNVAAFIEVKLTTERGSGFDRIANRIARFERVTSCYLASGGYDLMVVVEGHGLQEVARFVSEKLSTLEGVLSTATHFRLKVYKEAGFLFEVEEGTDRLPVAP